MDKEEADNLTGVGAKPENALSIASLAVSFGTDGTEPFEILTLINNKISVTWHFATGINRFAYIQCEGVCVSVLCLLCSYYPVSCV